MMKNTESTPRVGRGKWILGGVGALVVGAAGNGVWEYGMRPLLETIMRGVLTLSALPSSAVKDRVYMRVAAGLHEHDSNASLVILLAAMAMGFVIYMAKRGRSRPDTPSAKGNLGQLLDVCSSIVVLGATALLLAQALYVHQAIGHFERMITIAGPRLSDSARVELRSGFARIHSKAEYASLLSQIETVAREIDPRVETMDPW